MDKTSEWLAAYRRAEQTGDLHAIHWLEKQVFFETVEVVTRGEYRTASGRHVRLPAPAAMEKGSVFYRAPLEIGEGPGAYSTEYVVRDADCLSMGAALRAEHLDPVVLNMANQRNPGGGVRYGARAQEESIFRRTNIFRSLYQFADYGGKYGVSLRPERYPMADGYGGVYSPGAIVFRGERDEGYPLLETPYPLSFVTVAALCEPALDVTGDLAPAYAEETRRRMETILRIALVHGHDAIVLGAWGCGAFRNPPSSIARLFHEVLESPLFRGRFRKVVFAIIDDHNTHRRHNPTGNLLPFQLEFKKGPSSDASSGCHRRRP